MAIIKCKMCGDDLVLREGSTTATCESCGTTQTVPTADNEKKLNLFASANRLRAACEFDRAAGVYETITAEFPDEAEACWGLVLCKYGIEYVDDPATGKKIPTCHRSSYDSVMDDGNFEKAMENADAVARKVYREEARQIEEIRRGILTVSSKEAPYDIFICYKETDANGDRTLDSTLAQQLYSALTDKGYRVFFARVTLKGALGAAYEPLIFAALNSARVMLVIGTDYEYFNAVWVKNEWSRYLKLCAQSKDKHLIPCYKDIDAYDMPREFRPLQAVDLGQMGAIQDIVFNMEKYIPLKKNTNVIQEKVVVGGSGGSNKIASLLDRGNMALEDGNWAKADSFFEDVLNNDSRNAQAYIGKTLAMEKCRTIDALKRKRLESYSAPKSETLCIPERTAHVDEMAARCSLPGYVGETAILRLYDFDRSYASLVSGRQQQYREEELWWENHRQLSRAEKFAAGTVAENLRSEKQHLFAQLADRVKKAQEADVRAVAKLEAAYDAHIAQVDTKAEQLYNDGIAHREKEYQTWLEQAKKEISPDKLKKLADNFVSLKGYKDSKNLAEHCRKRAAEEQAKVDAEQERQRVIAEQKRKAQQKRKKTITTIAVACVVLAVTVPLLVTKVIIPGNAYKEAIALAENGQYQEARKAFQALGDFLDAKEQAHLMYERAVEIIRKEQEAKLVAEQKAEEERLAKAYAAAEELMENGETAKAAIAFGKLADYKDARERSMELWNNVDHLQSINIGEAGHSVALKSDGTVVTVGNSDDGRRDVQSWKDIVSVSAGAGYTVGLKSDGTVLAVGFDDNGRCDVESWKDIISINTGIYHTVGIKSDGTVVAAGTVNVSNSTKSENRTPNVKNWKDIVQVCSGKTFTLGLKSDGTVVSDGSNYFGQCDVSDWDNIASIDAGEGHSVGVRADGTVVAAGYNSDGQCDIQDWNDIVSIKAGMYHTVGLKSDGTVVAVGRNKYGQCDVSEWKDIVAIDVGASTTIGLKSDGTVVAVGYNENGQCNVSDWKDIKLPGTVNAT